MSESQVSRARTWGVLTLACLVIAAVVGAVVFDVTRRAGGMRAPTTSAAAVLQAPPGGVVKAVVRLEGAQANLYLAELLESVDGTTYRETPNHVQVALAPETQVVMGSPADVRPGAVVQLAGTIDGEHTIRAARIVILTGYVRVAG